MPLLLFTIIYCVITHLLNISYGPALGIYLIFFGYIKGNFSNKFHDFLNLEPSKIIYKQNGLKDSLTELLSLTLVFINSYLIANDPFTIFEFVYIFAVLGVVYRFAFWGITRTIREKDIFSRN